MGGLAPEAVIRLYQKLIQPLDQFFPSSQLLFDVDGVVFLEARQFGGRLYGILKIAEFINQPQFAGSFPSPYPTLGGFSTSFSSRFLPSATSWMNRR